MLSGHIRILSRNLHFGYIIVSEQTAVIIERRGKFHRILDPGFHFLVPLLDKNAYCHSLKEELYSIRKHAITKDRETIIIDGAFYLKVVDPYKASYGIRNPVDATLQLAETAIKSEVNKLTYRKVLRDKGNLSSSIMRVINESAEKWGNECKSFEIREISDIQININSCGVPTYEDEANKREYNLKSEIKLTSEEKLIGMLNAKDCFDSYVTFM